MAVHRLAIALEGCEVALDLSGETDHGAVRLELRERALQEGPGPFPAHPVHQVDRHVVRGTERGAKRIGPGRREASQRHRIQALVPHDDGVPLDVDAPPARAAGELGVLPCADVGVGLPVPLGELLQNHRAGRHVDPQRQRLRGEDGLDEPAAEQVLDDLLEGGQQPGVMGGDAVLQAFPPLREPEHPQVGDRDVAGALRNVGPHLAALLHAVEAQPGEQALPDSGVAAGPAEHEGDRGQQSFPVEAGHHVRTARRAQPHLRFPPSGSYRRPASLLPGHAEKLGIDPVRSGGLVPVCLLRHEQVEQLAVGEHVLPQRHGTVLLHDDPGVAADGDQPFGEFLGVAHRRRQRDQADLQRQVDDDLFPDRTAETVGQVVDLVHDDVPEAAQRVRVRVDHVAEHLGRHDDDGSMTVAGDVAGQQPDRLLAVGGDEVGVLLVRESLDRCRVEALATLPQGQVHGELAHDGLSGPCRSRHQHTFAGFEGRTSRPLEGVEREGIAGGEIGQGRAVRAGRAHTVRLRAWPRL